MPNREKVLKAANDLETLLPAAKEIVNLLRGRNDDSSYAMLYWLRREIGYITRELGIGVPSPYQMDFVDTFVKPQMQTDKY